LYNYHFTKDCCVLYNDTTIIRNMSIYIFWYIIRLC